MNSYGSETCHISGDTWISLPNVGCKCLKLFGYSCPIENTDIIRLVLQNWCFWVTGKGKTGNWKQKNGYEFKHALSEVNGSTNSGEINQCSSFELRYGLSHASLPVSCEHSGSNFSSLSGQSSKVENCKINVFRLKIGILVSLIALLSAAAWTEI